MRDRILITGGCGFVGANLIEALREHTSCEVRVLDNESMGSANWIKQFDVDFISGDIRNRSDLERALKDVDSVVHLAADTRVMDSIENPSFNFENNVAGTFGLLSAMRDLGVPKIINASSGGAILGEVPPPVHEEMVPRPTSPYGASKLAVEGYCSAFSCAYGTSTISLRFSNVYGVYSYHKGSVVAHFLKNIIFKRPLIVYGDGSQIRDYIFSRDLAKGILAALSSDLSGVYQLGSGKPTTINQLIEEMRAVVGSDYSFDVEYRDFREGEIRNTYCNIDKAKEGLDYAPEIELKQGLKITWDWFKSNKGFFEPAD